MKEKRLIIDTTLRDGEQSPFVHFSSNDKVRLAKSLDKTGIYQIEVGSCAIDITEQKTIATIMEQRENARISVWCRANLDDIKKAMETEPDVIHISVPVSYLHVYTKLRKNKVWINKTLTEIMDYLAGTGTSSKVSIGFEDATRAELSFLHSLTSLLEPYGVEMLRIADTVGSISPFAMRELIKEIGEHTNIPLEVHTHNDLGMAVANTFEALKAGALFADATLKGIGERSGNCDMEKMLLLISDEFDTGINIEAMHETITLFSSILEANGCTI